MTNCNKCGAPMAGPSQAGKMYCSAKCWLPKEQVTPNNMGEEMRAPIVYLGKQVNPQRAVDERSLLIIRQCAVKAAVELMKIDIAKGQSVLKAAEDFENWILR